MNREKMKMKVMADTRGEIVNVEIGKKGIYLVHSLPNSHRAGYHFPDAERKVSIIDGSLTFYFTNPENPEKEEKYEVLTGENIIIPKGTAYREFNEEEVYFASTCILGSGDRKLIYKPYREIVIGSLKL